MSVATIPQTDPKADAIGRRAFLNAGAGLAAVGSPAAAAVPLRKLGARNVKVMMRAQEALREGERSARSAIDGIAGLITVSDSNGKLETVNRQVLEYFGRSPEWLKNWGMNDAVHPEYLPRILELYKRATASGIPFNYKLRLRRFDGEYRWFDNRGVPVRDDSGRIVRWYVLLTDIEDRTRAPERSEQMQSDFDHMNRVSAMGELTASLAHEITQPIAAARNYARAVGRHECITWGRLSVLLARREHGTHEFPSLGSPDWRAA